VFEVREDPAKSAADLKFKFDDVAVSDAAMVDRWGHFAILKLQQTKQTASEAAHHARE
jgi:hypothetical protein